MCVLYIIFDFMFNPNLDKISIHMEQKRLFFGASIIAPWPEETPEGRTVAPEHRHLTLAFLGQTDYSLLQPLLPQCPIPLFRVGIVGKSDCLLFLPEKQPRVIAYHANWLGHEELLRTYQKQLSAWLHAHHLIAPSEREFLSHISLARKPFDTKEWQMAYTDLPLLISGIHLYESVGGLNYQPLWSHPLILPFEEIEHTADMAFKIRGETKKDLHLHAQMALAFKFPSLLPYLTLDSLTDTWDDMVISLNHIITRADAEIGSPIKAVSFHGTIGQDPQGLFNWEMIIDV